MNTTMVLLSLLAVLALTAYLAFRAYDALRVHRYVRTLQKVTLSLCSDIMSDKTQSNDVRQFAAGLSVAAADNTVLRQFGNGRLLKLADGGGSRVPDSVMTAMKPALDMFALASLLYDRKTSRLIRAHWDQHFSEVYSRAVRPDAKPARREEFVPSAPPVRKKVGKIEVALGREIRREMSEAFCAA